MEAVVQRFDRDALVGSLGLEPFRPRSPWLSGDLQTLRDTLRPVPLPPESGQHLPIPVDGDDQLLAVLDPSLQGAPRGLVLLMHGLAGSSDRGGLRRMGDTLQRRGFAVARLNMRGAGAGRALARGTYAANSNRDLLPVLRRLRELSQELAPGGLPLLGMGISLGGTKLLNALLASAAERAAAGLSPEAPLFDGLVTISSPLDLQTCSRQIERPRNRVYERWLLRRLVAQTLADPFGVSASEREMLEGRGPGGPLRSIRAFDAAITAPRWGYRSVEHYYREASPLPKLLAALERGTASAPLHQEPGSPLPPALIVHAEDDPWVPVAATRELALAAAAAAARPGAPEARWPLQVLLTPLGGHNGFHAAGDGPSGRGGCWTDRLTARWFEQLLADQAPLVA
jgi:predicted alpha/beta-fold hydrolase